MKWSIPRKKNAETERERKRSYTCTKNSFFVVVVVVVRIMQPDTNKVEKKNLAKKPRTQNNELFSWEMQNTRSVIRARQQSKKKQNGRNHEDNLRNMLNWVWHIYYMHSFGPIKWTIKRSRIYALGCHHELVSFSCTFFSLARRWECMHECRSIFGCFFYALNNFKNKQQKRIDLKFLSFTCSTCRWWEKDRDWMYRHPKINC